MYTIERTAEQEHWFPILEELFSNGPTEFIGPAYSRTSNLTRNTHTIRVGLPIGRQQAVAIPAEALRHLPARLIELGLNHYRISNLPDDFGVLYPSLKYLSMRNVGLTDVPRSMGGMRSLRVLSLDSNQLTDLPPTLMHIPTLSHLTLSNNPKLLAIPRVVFYLRYLDSLYMDRCGITQISGEIANLAPTLRLLGFSGNRLKGDAVPWDTLSTMPKLASMTLSGNPLRHMPERFVGRFQNIISIFLSDVELMEFPMGVLRMTKLGILSLQGNYIREIPKEIEQLVNLRILELQRNPTLRRIPNELGSNNMPHFNELHITQYPNTFRELRYLNFSVMEDLTQRNILQLHME